MNKKEEIKMKINEIVKDESKTEEVMKVFDEFVVYINTMYTINKYI